MRKETDDTKGNQMMRNRRNVIRGALTGLSRKGRGGVRRRGIRKKKKKQEEQNMNAVFESRQHHHIYELGGVINQKLQHSRSIYKQNYNK